MTSRGEMGGGTEAQEGGATCIYISDSQQRPTQHGKAVVLRLKRWRCTHAHTQHRKLLFNLYFSGPVQGISGFTCIPHFSSSQACCYVVLSRSSHIQLFETLWTVAHQVPLSMQILQARTLEWVDMPSSRGSSQPRDWTQVFRIAGGFFTSWTTRETPCRLLILPYFLFFRSNTLRMFKS